MTAIEYAVLSSLIAVVIILAITGIGGELKPTFTTISGTMKIANANAASTPGGQSAHDDNEHEDDDDDDELEHDDDGHDD